VRLHVIAAEDYAENSAQVDITALPVFVRLLRRGTQGDRLLGGETADITRIVADVLQRQADRVHIELAPPAVGRMAFGGHIVE
jgi:hypothetical protein